MTTIESGALAQQQLYSQQQAIRLQATQSITKASLKVTVEVGQTDVAGPSDIALVLMQRISQSDKLTRNDKESLIRLVAIVEEFGGDNMAELYEEIFAIIEMIELMNQQREIKNNAMSMREAMEIYLEQRRALQGDDSVAISAELEVTSFRMTMEASLTANAEEMDVTAA